MTATIKRFVHQGMLWPIDVVLTPTGTAYVGHCTCGFVTLPKESIAAAELRLTQHVKEA